MTMIKLSFVCFFRRIFVESQRDRKFNTISAAAGVIVALWGLTFVLFELFDCAHHFSARWSTNATHKSVCRQANNAMLSLAITDWITDLMILLLPVSMVCEAHGWIRTTLVLTSVKILQLKSEWRRKLAILSVFGVGCL